MDATTMQGSVNESWLRARNIDELADEELIAAVMGGERSLALDRAGRALAMFESMRGLARAGIGETRAVLGRANAIRLAAAMEIARRASVVPLRPDTAVGSSRDVVRAFGPRMVDRVDEVVLAVVLDARRRPLAERVMARGVPTSCAVTVREVFALAVREGGAGVLVVHNHPSGDPTPSREDVVWTRQLFQAGELLGVPLVDHVIVAREGSSSMLDLGLLVPVA